MMHTLIKLIRYVVAAVAWLVIFCGVIAVLGAILHAKSFVGAVGFWVYFVASLLSSSPALMIAPWTRMPIFPYLLAGAIVFSTPVDMTNENIFGYNSIWGSLFGYTLSFAIAVLIQLRRDKKSK